MTFGESDSPVFPPKAVTPSIVPESTYHGKTDYGPEPLPRWAFAFFGVVIIFFIGLICWMVWWHLTREPRVVPVSAIEEEMAVVVEEELDAEIIP